MLKICEEQKTCKEFNNKLEAITLGLARLPKKTNDKVKNNKTEKSFRFIFFAVGLKHAGTDTYIYC